MMALRRYLTPILAVTLFATCDEFPEDPMGTDLSGPIQLNLSTSEWPDVMALGGTLDLEVRVTDTQGHAILDPPIGWSVDTPGTGSLDGGASGATASIVGTSLGWLRITVSLDDVEDRFTAGSVTDSIQVMLAGVRMVAPSGDTTLVSLGDTVVVEAAGTEFGGASVGYDAFEWDHQSGALEMLDAGDAILRLRSVAQGADTIWARAPGVCPGGMCEAKLIIRVEQEPVSVQINPPSATVERDSMVQLIATAFDARGHDITGTPFVWNSANTSVASVNSSGRVTGVAEGETTVTARVQDTFLGADATITVIRGRGGVEGTIYRDDDASGSFDAGADTPLTGAPVDLILGTSPGGTVWSSTTTDNAGFYQFAGVPAGDYVVVVTAPPATTIDVPTAQVAVDENLTTIVDFTFTGAPVVPISDARAAVLDELVAIEGVVTSATTGEGVLADSIFYMQDGSAAIAVYTSTVHFPGGFPLLSIGDSVRVLGTRQVAVNQLEWIEAESVAGLGTGRADTLDVGTYDINNLVYPSRLVRVWDVMIDSVTDTASQNVWARGNMELGGIGFRMYLNPATGLNGDSVFHLHRAYTVTGILTRHNTTYELKPRKAADIGFGLVPLTSIGIARELTPDSMWISVAGVVSAGTDAFGPNQFYMQDATAGIRVYLPADSFPGGVPPVAAGDSVRIQGARLTYNQEAEVMASYLSVEGFSGEPPPYGISVGEINAGDAQGELHGVSEVLVDSITGSFNEYVWVSGPSTGEDLVIYLDGDTGIDGPSTFTVGNYYDITGVVSRYNAQYQLKPRSPADVVEIISPISIADARAAGIGTELAVTGVLSAGVAEFDANVMYVQDGTVGIQLLFPAAYFAEVPVLGIGDSVRVTGFRAETGGVPRIDVYDFQEYGGGFLVDTLATTPGDVDAGLNPGKLVRLDQMRTVEIGNGLALFEDAFGQGVWVRTDHLPAETIGIDGVYDLVGVVSWLDGGGIFWLMPRGDFDVTTLTPASNLWATFVNVPTSQIDTVVFSYSIDTAVEPFQDADRSPIHYGAKVADGSWISWAWVAWAAGGGVGYRSLDLGKQLDGSVDVAVIPCLQVACAAGDGTVAAPLTRSAVQADYEFYGLFPSAELAEYNEGLDDAYGLETVFVDELAGREYWAHTGQLEDLADPSDFYTFYANAGDVVTVETYARRVQASGDLDTWLYVFDPNKSPIGDNDDIVGGSTVDSRVTFTAATTGYHYVQMTKYAGSGVYTLMITVDYQP